VSETERPTVGAAIRAAAAELEAIGGSGRLDAELLMAHVLGVSRSELLLRHMGDLLPEGFAALAERRRGHEPIAYITGEQEFFGLPFRVNAHVLIPRADSEVLVETALAHGSVEGRPGRRVLDCGTGSGALILAVLANLPGAMGLGIDRSAGALAVARHNAVALGLDDRAEFALADWHTAGWRDGLGPFDLILANPPYVEAGALLARSVRDHEPAGALFAGPDGLDDYRVLVPQLPELMTTDATALVEIGATQADAVATLAADCGMVATLHHDLAGRPRLLALVIR
jgi:release factor glutamine methyltransferase